MSIVFLKDIEIFILNMLKTLSDESVKAFVRRGYRV